MARAVHDMPIAYHRTGDEEGVLGVEAELTVATALQENREISGCPQASP